MEQKALADLIEKYLKGDCTPEEIDLVHQWYDSFQENGRPADFSDPRSTQLLEENIFVGVKTKIRDLQVGRFAQKRNRSIRYIGVAASIGALLFLANILYQRSTPVAVLQPAKRQQFYTVKNITHSLMKQILPDSSEVWLNPGSEIHYPAGFSNLERRVKMHGEVFFMVTKNKQRPFIIESGRIETRVWGTSFRVRDSGGSAPQVNVATGLVSVKLNAKPGDEIMLKANEKTIMESRSGRMAKISDKKPDKDMKMWKKVNLSFSDAPVKEVIVKLNENYGSEITTSDQLIENYLLTADFSNQNLPDVLDMLRKSLNINYEIKGTSIILINN